MKCYIFRLNKRLIPIAVPLENNVRCLAAGLLIIVFSLAVGGCSDLLTNTSDDTTTTTTTTTTDSSPQTPPGVGTSSEGGTSTTTTTASESSTWNYTTESPVLTLSADTLSLDITGDGLAGKTVYMARVNPTDSKISSSYVRYVSESSGFETDLSYSGTDSSTGSPGGGTSGPFMSSSDIASSENVSLFKNFIPPQTFSRTVNLSASAASRAVETTEIDRSDEQLDRTVGETTKDIYVDQDSYVSTFAQEEATLYYAGTYCNVWIVNDYYADTASGEYVDSDVAESVGKNFDNVYPMVRNIYGDESDDIYYSYTGSAFTEDDLEKLSNTGNYTDDDGNTVNYVNIVLYDIGKDHDDGDTSGIVGYFYAKDYYPDEDDLESITGYQYSTSSACRYSNEGKYFYVDTYYANEYSDIVRSTLPHEFQHMIDYGVKVMDYDLSPSTWYNEMMSMLCEDMMQNYLDIEDDDSPKDRLPTFNQYYRYVGLEFNEDNTSYTLISYSTAYAFGAWLTRQFGGAELVHEMAQNEYVDTDSVVNAVNTVNSGGSYTIEDLLEMYAEACVFNTSDTSYTYPTFNQSQELSSGDDLYYDAESYGYPLAAIDLWDSAYEWTDDESVTETGPQLFDNDDLYDLRPYGFTLHELGTVPSNTTEIELNFSSSSSSKENVYLFVQ